MKKHGWKLALKWLPASKSFRRIVLSITGILVAASGIVLSLIYFQSGRLKYNVAEKQISQAMRSFKTEIDQFFIPVNNSAELIYSWGKSGLLDNIPTSVLVSKLAPFIQKLSQTDFISYTSSEGIHTVITRVDQFIETRSLEYLHDTMARVSVWSAQHELLSEQKIPIRSSTIERIKSLMESEKEADGITWSSARNFFEIDGMGICANSLWFDSSTGIRSSLSFGIKLTTISGYMESLKTGSGGEFMFFMEDGRFFQPGENVPEDNETDETYYLVPADSIAGTIEHRAIKVWQENRLEGESKHRFAYRNETWWAGMMPLNNYYTFVWLGVLFPEHDLIQFIGGTRGILSIIFLLILLFSVLFSVLVILRHDSIRKPLPPKLQDLIDEQAILNLIKKGESDLLEFKSTVRMNLHSGKSGKEMELAWLKGLVAFMNADGGIVLIGVTDSGELHGLKSDDFVNDDKCLLHVQNLVKQHIGLEFSRYVNFEIREVSNVKILIIECIPSKNPVFLKHNDKEQFYVRSGPSSVELPVSKALKYINDRKES